MRLTVQLNSGMRASYHRAAAPGERVERALRPWPRIDRVRPDWGRLPPEGREQLLRNQQQKVEKAPAAALSSQGTTRALQPRPGLRLIRRGGHYVPVFVRPEGVRGRPRPDLPRARRELLRLRRRRQQDR